MARGAILTGFLGLLACVLIILHLIFFFEDTQPPIWYYSKSSSYSGRPKQPDWEDDVFLLGAGKADITG